MTIDGPHTIDPWVLGHLTENGLRLARCSYCGREHSPTPKGNCKGCAAPLPGLLGQFMGVPVCIADPMKASRIFYAAFSR